MELETWQERLDKPTLAHHKRKDLKRGGKILKRMRRIVAAERLVQKHYIAESGLPTLPDLPPLCNGYEFCAIGSLIVSDGAKPERRVLGSDTSMMMLPGAMESERAPYMDDHPATCAAYIALNEAAQEYADAFDVRLDFEHNAPIEQLFEGSWNDALTTEDLLSVVDSARLRLRNERHGRVVA